MWQTTRQLEKMWWFVLIALASLRVPARGLSNLRVHIPATVQKGQSPLFECTFTLEDERLYAIKWYRGNYEIFRYIPSETPPIKTFALEGYNVSSSNSTGRTLQLYQVDFVNSGAYSCEVIVDTTFHTLIETKKMLVIQTPSLKPTISAVKEEYNLGERINPMCTSWNSHPPANLSWFINGEPARQSYLRRYDLRKEHDGTFTSVLGLQFDLAQHHFKNGKLTLQCTATILSVYWRSTEAYVKEASLYPSQVLINSGKSYAGSGNSKNSTKVIVENSLESDGSNANINNTKNNNNNNMPVEQLTSHMLSSSTRSRSSTTTSCCFCLVIAYFFLSLCRMNYRWFALSSCLAVAFTSSIVASSL